MHAKATPNVIGHAPPLAERVACALDVYETQQQLDGGPLFSACFIAQAPHHLAKSGIELKTTSLQEFDFNIAALIDLASAYHTSGAIQKLACVLTIIDSAWKATSINIQELSRDKFKKSLEAFSLMIFEKAEVEHSITNHKVLCAQLALWIAQHPGEAVSPIPEGEPKHHIAWKYNDQRIHEVLNHSPIVIELQFGDERSSVCSAFRYFEHHVRMLSGLLNDIAKPLLDKAIRGTTEKDSIYTADLNPAHRESVAQLAIGLYQLIRNPTVHESKPVTFQDALEQVHAISFITRLLDTPHDWAVHNDRSDTQIQLGSALKILPMQDITSLNARVAQHACSLWSESRFSEATQAGAQAFRMLCKEYLGSTSDLPDKDLCQQIAKKLQKEGFNFHRAWAELAGAALALAASPLHGMYRDHHSQFAMLCIFSQLAEKLPGFNSKSRQDSLKNDGKALVAENQKVIEFSEVTSWLKALAQTEFGKKLPEGRFPCDFTYSRALLTKTTLAQSTPMSAQELDDLDDFVQGLIFFMRDLPAHYRFETGPDAAVEDYKLCSSLVFSLFGLGTEAECAAGQKVLTEHADIKNYASTLHPHLAAQIGGLMIKGELNKAAESALAMLKETLKNISHDATLPGQMPADLRTHYLERLLRGSVAYFEHLKRTGKDSQFSHMQAIAISNQTIGIKEPQVHEGVHLLRTDTPDSISETPYAILDKQALQIIAVTNQLVRRVTREPEPPQEVTSFKSTPTRTQRRKIAEPE